METKKRISVEKGVLYMLTRWHNIDQYDYHGVVQRLYSQHRLMPSQFNKTNLCNAPLMQDPWVRAVYIDKNGDRYFENLNGIIDLYNAGVSGEIELDIVPSVLQGVIYDANNLEGATRKVAELALPFIQQYATVLRVNKEDYDEFFDIRRGLAKKYINAGILKNDQYTQACALAETAMFGLNYVVKKASLYIHEDCRANDCKKMRKIAEIHREAGLITTDKHDGSRSVPKVWSPRYLMLRDAWYEQGDLSYSLWIDPTYMEDNTYIAPSKRK